MRYLVCLVFFANFLNAQEAERARSLELNRRRHAYEGVFEIRAELQGKQVEFDRLTVIESGVSPSDGPGLPDDATFKSASVAAPYHGQKTKHFSIMNFAYLQLFPHPDKPDTVILDGNSDFNQAPNHLYVEVNQLTGNVTGNITTTYFLYEPKNHKGNDSKLITFSFTGKRLVGPSDYYAADRMKNPPITDPEVVSGSYAGKFGDMTGTLNVLYDKLTDEFESAFLLKDTQHSTHDLNELPWSHQIPLTSARLGELDKEFGIFSLVGGHSLRGMHKWILPCVVAPNNSCACEGVAYSTLTGDYTPLRFVKQSPTSRGLIPGGHPRNFKKQFLRQLLMRVGP